MTKETIKGGMIIAMQKGFTFNSALQSFINAGYPEQDIKAAMNELKGVSPNQQQVEVNQQISQTPFRKLPIVKLAPQGTSFSETKQQTIQKPVIATNQNITLQQKPFPSLEKTQPVKPIQRVSNYEDVQKKKIILN